MPEQFIEQPVQFVTETSAIAAYDLVEEFLRVDDDRAFSVNIQILERDVEKMRALQAPKRIDVWAQVFRVQADPL
jgi:hypothetical protein